MANFPTTAPSLGTYTDNVDYPQAAHVNNVNREVEAIGGILTPGTHITGMKGIWNSATSIGVDIGACACENGDIITSTSVITKSSLSLSSSTMYHVYAYLSGGSPAAEVVTTAPTAWKSGAYSKTGDTSRRYLFSVLADGSSNVNPFVHYPASNMMVYYNVAKTASPFRVLNGGTASTATAVSVSGCVPTTGTAVIIEAYSVASTNLRIDRSSSVSSTQFIVFVPPGDSAAKVLSATIPVASQQFYYKFDSAPSGSANIDVDAYLFDR